MGSRELRGCPFPFYLCSVEHDEPWVAANHGLEDNFVDGAERIFGSCRLAPLLDVVGVALGQAYEHISLLCAVVCKLGKAIHHSVVGLGETWGYYQKFPPRTVDDAVGEVAICAWLVDLEVGDIGRGAVFSPCGFELEVCAYVVWPEVYQWYRVDGIYGQYEGVYPRIHGDNPLVGDADEPGLDSWP